MSPDDISAKAEGLRREARRIPTPGMRNYTAVMASYKHILDEVLVSIKEVALLLAILYKERQTMTDIKQPPTAPPGE